MKRSFPWFSAAVGAVLCATSASAQIAFDDPRLKTDRILYEYEMPKDPAHLALYEDLKKRRVLEKFQEFLAPFRLPIPVTLKTLGCNGVVNSYFEVDTVKICYEYLAYIETLSPKMVRQGLTPHDAMIGPLVDVFLHEFGHAIVRVLDVPFFAREEDVADYIATYILLSLAKDDARRLLLGAAFIAGAEAMKEQGNAEELTALADSHSLPSQRFFSKWCMAYGSNKELFADAIELGMLPPNRVKWCRWEWDTNEEAFKRLVMPYIDRPMMDKNLAKKWFPFESPVAATMNAPQNVAKDPQAQDPARTAK